MDHSETKMLNIFGTKYLNYRNHNTIIIKIEIIKYYIEMVL